MNKTISVSQLFILLFLSRIFTTIINTIDMNKAPSPTNQLLAYFISGIILLLLLIPTYFLFKQNDKENIADVAKNKNKYFGAIVSFLYAGLFFTICVSTILKLSKFLSSQIFNKSSSVLIIVAMMIVVLLAIYNKIEALARTSSIILFFFLIALGFIFISSSKNINLNNLLLNGGENSLNLIDATLQSLYQNIDFVGFLFLIKTTNKNPTKKMWVYVLTVLAIIEAISFFIITVIGNYLYQKEYPFYALTTMSEMSIFERLDSIHMGIWVGIALVKITLFLLLSVESLASMNGNKKQNKITYFLWGSLVLISIATSFNIENIDLIEKLIYNLVVFCCAVFVIPLIVFLFQKRSKSNWKKYYYYLLLYSA